MYVNGHEIKVDLLIALTPYKQETIYTFKYNYDC